LLSIYSYPNVKLYSELPINPLVQLDYNLITNLLHVFNLALHLPIFPDFGFMVNWYLMF